MTKKEWYFVLFFVLGYAFVFFLPPWLGAQFDVSSDILIISGALLYLLFAIGSFSMASIPLFVRSRLKQKGRLTQTLNRALVISGITLFVILGSYAFLTGLLPLLADFPASCCGTCPSPNICWAGIPMNRTLYDALMISYTVLSCLSLPFFILWIVDTVISFKRSKHVHPQTEVES